MPGRWPRAIRRRARRLVDESQRLDDWPQTYLCLAYGLKARDPAAADQAFWEGIREIDRLPADKADDLALRDSGGIATLLPLVEQIDPTLVPEVFWRTVAGRPPTGNPRSFNDESLSDLVMLLGWYDRDVAAAVFEPVRHQMEQTDERELPPWTLFRNWSLFDPRAAVASIEGNRPKTETDTKAVLNFSELVESLSIEPRTSLRGTVANDLGRLRLRGDESPPEREIW